MKTINLFLHRLNCLLTDTRLWQWTAFLVLCSYLAPLIVYGEHINILVFDNIDSNVVWLKILAESGLIFAPNDAVVPNMMSGLPRLSYGSEFNVLLWLYYLLPPIIAYTVNIILIHMTAFFSMFLLSHRYLVDQKIRYRHVIVYVISIIFAVMPFWPSGGLTIAALPLITYAFANIFFYKDRIADWLILILVPFYSSFVLLYVFFLGFAGLFLIGYTLYARKFNRRFAAALLMVFCVYMLIEYRLVGAMLLQNSFVSHRSEFDIFFSESFADAAKRFYQFFLHGHATHLKGLQMPFIMPFILFALFLLPGKRRMSPSESLVLILMFVISLWLGLWDRLSASDYFIPSLLVVTLLVLSYVSQRKKLLPWILLFYTGVSAIYGFVFYDGLSWVTDVVPLFRSFSLGRAAFVQPLLIAWLGVLALQVIFRKLHFPVFISAGLLGLQCTVSFEAAWHSIAPVKGYASFKDYYAVEQFEELKKDMGYTDSPPRFISYGIEPAVALYNGLYTVDGYSNNYPLAYKHRFNRVNTFGTAAQSGLSADDPAGKWGSKLYIMGIRSAPEDYKRGLEIEVMLFNMQALKALGANYLLSSYRLNDDSMKGLEFIKKYQGGSQGWDIYLYRIRQAF